MRKNIRTCVLITLIGIAFFYGCKPKEKINTIPIEKKIDANSVPYYILGDINGDGVVNQDDLTMLTKYFASEGKEKCTILAAADWSGNGVVDKNDLKIMQSIFELKNNIEIPTLTSQNRIAFDYTKAVLFAPAYTMVGASFKILFNDESSNPEIELTDKQITVAYDSLKKEYTLHIPDSIHNESKIDILITITDKDNKTRKFILHLPVRPKQNVAQAAKIIPLSTIHDSAADCKQRNKGCEVLIIDFMHANEFFAFLHDSKDLVDPFKNCGCNVIYVAPKMQALPTDDSILVVDKVAAVSGGGIITYKKILNPNFAKEWQAANNSNDVEWNKLNNAIRQHQTLIKKGRELVIELVNAHGDTRSWGSCYLDYRDLYRDTFHLNNYSSANGNCCDWFTYDLSCHAGYTPIIVENLENKGIPSMQPSGAKGNFHAAFEYDYSYGSCKRTEESTYGHSNDMDVAIKGMLNTEADSRKKNSDAGHPDTDYSRLSQTLKASSDFLNDVLYIDKGFKFCPTIQHNHIRVGIN